MKISQRYKKTRILNINDKQIVVNIIEIPFREGVEVEAVVNGEIIRVSDRQLGEDEAIRILERLIKEKI
jgi:hypothetical protein